jgi:hypothetical protein
MSRSDPRATCETCQYFAADPHPEKEPRYTGLCRVMAPRFLVPAYERKWPPVTTHDWCGEHVYLQPRRADESDGDGSRGA